MGEAELWGYEVVHFPRGISKRGRSLCLVIYNSSIDNILVQDSGIDLFVICARVIVILIN